MPESPEVEALVERLVRESGIPDARDRDALRRELLGHFAEAGEAAARRFGNAEAVTDAFRRAYRGGRRLLYAGKIVAAIVASTTVALVLQAIVSFPFSRWSSSVHAPFDPVSTAVFSVVLVLVAVTAWELGIEPLCARLERRPARLAMTFVTLLAGAHVTHSFIATFAKPAHDLAASTMTVATWISTIAILARIDIAFLRLFGVSASR